MEKNQNCNWYKASSAKVQVVIDGSEYNIAEDKRFFIPFLKGDISIRKWGVMNRKGEIIIQPEYDFVNCDFYSESTLIRVGITHHYDKYSSGFYPRHRVGLFDALGNSILDVIYSGIIESTDKTVFTVNNMEGLYGVVNNKKEIVVPFGKYTYISGFDCGLARVIRDNKWGIVDEKGEEVLPAIYDKIWNFYRKNRDSTNVVKDGNQTLVYFRDLNPSLTSNHSSSNDYDESDYEADNHYGEYAGSYAQDVMGYSDEDINDAFDGDPDAYWNID